MMGYIEPGVSTSEKRGGLVITVSDTGIGIPAGKAQELIFEPFWRVDGSVGRTTAGVGIGLSIVRSLVQVMGGTIYLDSTLGKGSTFTVNLPPQATDST